MFPKSRNTGNTNVFIGFAAKQRLGPILTSRHMEKVLRIRVSVCKICSKVRFVNLLLVDVVDGSKIMHARASSKRPTGTEAQTQPLETYNTPEKSGLHKRRPHKILSLKIKQKVDLELADSPKREASCRASRLVG